jgi:sentrin-specific protease 8
MITRNQLLPPGWKIKEVVRKNGASAGKIDVYIISPCGKTLRSKRELLSYISDNNLPLTVDEFNLSAVRKMSRNNTNESLSLNSQSSIHSTDFDLSSSTSSELLMNEVEFPSNKPVNESKASDTESHLNLAISLLKGEWVTDDSISLYLSMLDTMLQKQYSVSLIQPAISQIIKCSTDFESVLLSNCLRTKSYIIIPINDSQSDKEEVSGSHWSLLFYLKVKNTFLYFDSLVGSNNYLSAMMVAEKLNTHLNGSSEPIKFSSYKIPQQKNGSDCGVFMIITIDILIANIMKMQCCNSYQELEINISAYNDFNIWSKRAQLASVLCNKTKFTGDMSNIFPQMIGSLNVGSNPEPVLRAVQDKGIQVVILKNNSDKEDAKVEKENVHKHAENDWEKINHKNGRTFYSTRRNKQFSNHKVDIEIKNRYECLSEVTEIDRPDVQVYEGANSSSQACKLKVNNTRIFYNKKYSSGTGRYGNIKYANKNLKKFSGNNKKVNSPSTLVIGDSITKHVNIPDAEILSFSGMKSYQFQEKLNSAELGAHQPEVVVLHMGTNDLGLSHAPDDVMGWMRGAIISAKKLFTKSKIIVNGIVMRRDFHKSIIFRTNSNIRSVCRNLGVIFVDVNKQINDTCLGRDGLHLNRRGSTRLSDIIYRVVNICKTWETCRNPQCLTKTSNSKSEEMESNLMKSINTSSPKDVHGDSTAGEMTTLNLADMSSFPPLRAPVADNSREREQQGRRVSATVVSDDGQLCDVYGAEESSIELNQRNCQTDSQIMFNLDTENKENNSKVNVNLSSLQGNNFLDHTGANLEKT